jgi:hypothetical protein
MRVYPDTSFLVRLVTEEPGTEAAMADYHRLGRPAMFYLPLHALEAANAVRQRAFHLRRSAPASTRAAIKREIETALALLSKFIARRVLIESAVDLDKAIEMHSPSSTPNGLAAADSICCTSRWRSNLNVTSF